jgi:hypothetical protein
MQSHRDWTPSWTSRGPIAGQPQDVAFRGATTQCPPCSSRVLYLPGVSQCCAHCRGYIVGVSDCVAVAEHQCYPAPHICPSDSNLGNFFWYVGPGGHMRKTWEDDQEDS